MLAVGVKESEARDTKLSCSCFTALYVCMKALCMCDTMSQPFACSMSTPNKWRSIALPA